MDFIEELIRRGPGKENVKGFVRKAAFKTVNDYWDQVYTEENLKDQKTFTEAWEEWFEDYKVLVYDFVELYHKKTEDAMIWGLYDVEDVYQCITYEMLEPIIHAEGCNCPEHEDVKFSK